MKNVKVILRSSVEKLGDTGEVVSVRSGFARNFLLPQGLAYEATSDNLRRIEIERRRLEDQTRRDLLEAKRRASVLENISLTFEVRAGEESKLFGSITSADIADRLNEQGLDFEVDRKQIDLEDPIKTLGVYGVPVRLHADVRPDVKIWVVKEE